MTKDGVVAAEGFGAAYRQFVDNGWNGAYGYGYHPVAYGAAVATTAAVGVSALAAGALTYSLLRRFAF